MSDPYVGEIRLIAGFWVPEGWQLCDGTLLSTTQYNELFYVIGTAYGGDGTSTFAVPDMRGRVPIHRGQGTAPLSNRLVGQTGGTEAVALQTQHIPPHSHPVKSMLVNATATSPDDAMLAGVVTPTPPTPPVNPLSNTFYALNNANSFNPATLNAASIAVTGQNALHENRMPSVAMSYMIALSGLFPSN